MGHAWNWMIQNWLEVVGMLVGLIYIVLSIRQNRHTWTAGLLTSLIYCLVFYQSRFYAGMVLQAYYVVISIYGWFAWKENSDSLEDVLKVSQTSLIQWAALGSVFISLLLVIYFGLKNFTDSPVPLGDGLATSLSFIATWMLARKKLENWILWVVIDIFSVGLYVWQGLYPTAILYLVYGSMAFLGYREWKKSMMPIPEVEVR